MQFKKIYIFDSWVTLQFNLDFISSKPMKVKTGRENRKGKERDR